MNLMKNLIGCLIGLAACFGIISANAQVTAFTYQGRLNSGSSPANGNFDVAFRLYTTNTAGSLFAGPMTNTAVPVTNGLFATTVDFGAGIFTGTNLWLELSVRTNGSGSFVILSPRQPVTPTPYALFAPNAGSADSVPATHISGAISLGQLATNSFGSAAFQPSSAFATSTNPVIYDSLGRPTLYLPNPFITNIVLFTNKYFVNFSTNNLGYNGTYTFWPNGSTNTYLVYTNLSATKLLVKAYFPDPFGFGDVAMLLPASQFPITAGTISDFDNLGVSADPVVSPWENSNTGTLVYPNIAALAFTSQTNVTTNLAPTILTNVFIANLGASLTPAAVAANLTVGAIGAVGLLSNNISGQLYPSVLVTNTSLSIGWLGDSIGLGYQANTNFVLIAGAFATKVAAAAGHTAPSLIYALQSGITSYYISTNANYGYYWTVMVNETGINDLRYGLTNWGITPDFSLINSQSNMIKRAAASGSKLFILSTVPDWCSYYQYTNLGSATDLTSLLGTNVTWTTNNNGFTYAQFLQELQNVRRWQLAQITNASIPVLVVDLKTLPIDQCLADGLHPNDFGQRLIGNLFVQSLQLGWCPQVPVNCKQSISYEDSSGVFTVYPHRSGTNIFFSTQP